MRAICTSCRRPRSCRSTTCRRRCWTRCPTGDRSTGDLADSLAPRWSAEDIRSSIDELLGMRAIHTVAAPPPKPVAEKPKRRIPLQTLVLNVTSKCNLSCGYCYEYGEDKIVEAKTKPRFMSDETARQSVDFMFDESGDAATVNLTFFGGETLLNFKMLQSSLAYAKERARGPRQAGQREPDDERDAPARRSDRLDDRERRRRHRVDRRRARTAGQASRVLERHGQLRHHRAAHQGIARAPSPAPGWRARHADRTESRRRIDLQAPVRGDRLLGSRVRARHDLMAARVRDRERRLSANARRLPVARAGVSPGGARRDGGMASPTCATRSRRFTRA